MTSPASCHLELAGEAPAQGVGRATSVTRSGASRISSGDAMSVETLAAAHLAAAREVTSATRVPHDWPLGSAARRYRSAP